MPAEQFPSPTLAVPSKSYYAIRFSDIDPRWILGLACMGCGHVGVIDRTELERRFGAHEFLRFADDRVACKACGNQHHNYFALYGVKGGVIRRPG